jgi:hypothetical protein
MLTAAYEYETEVHMHGNFNRKEYLRAYGDFFEELTVATFVKKCGIFYEIRKILTVITKCRYSGE